MKKHSSNEMVSTKNKSKVLSCSTPEQRAASPSRDSDSICNSECASPVPFLCTQDGAEGETDVVWNFYTPKSENIAKSRIKNSTPLSRRPERSLRPEAIERQIPKRRHVKPSQKKTELFQELIELNQNLNELMGKNQNKPEKPQSGSEDDIFIESQDCSSKCISKSSSRCLRKNLLSSNIGQPDPETALESDDSMNECLLKASQIVEEKFLQNDAVPAKKLKYENCKQLHKTNINFKMDHNSMDAIINSIKLASPAVSKVKKCNSPCLNNDSFDSLVGNLNDSALEQLTQMPIKSELPVSKPKINPKEWTVKELLLQDSSPPSKSFGRYNSMPESPSVPDMNKPSTSGMAFGRYSSMPYENEADESTMAGDSPIRCTPDEIKKKHQLARERLMAKRLLPFTSSQQTQSLPTRLTQKSKKTLFQPKVASSTTNVIKNGIAVSNMNSLRIASSATNGKTNNIPVNNNNTNETTSSSFDLKKLIEKKRQEALMKLRRRLPQQK